LAAAPDKKKPRRRLLWLVPIACAVFFGAVFFAQQQKLASIDKEQEQYEKELLALQNEKVRIERMIEYAKTEQYRLEYAREVLGFVMPDDICFDLEP